MSKKSVAIAALALFLSAQVTLAQDTYTWPANSSNLVNIIIASVTQHIRVKIRKLEGNTVPISITCGNQRSTLLPDAGPLTYDCDGNSSGVNLFVTCGRGTGSCKFEVTDITK